MSWGLLAEVFRLVGPQQSVEIFGIRLVGVNADNGIKLLMSVVFVVIVMLLTKLARRIARWLLKNQSNTRLDFWRRQIISLASAGITFVGLASIWFDDPTRLATALGLVTAGLAFALQKVVTAIAGYFIILRGKTFNVGDRIRMGGVRGDVIALDFTQTTIMEMGQPPSVQGDEPAMWVKSRQYTGRIVTVSNSKIFDEPVYNYSREFPFMWEEMSLPVPYGADRERAEQILLEVARRHTERWSNLGEQTMAEMKRRYFMASASTEPKVYYRLTDNWLELTVRFVCDAHGVRELKDALSRDLLRELNEAGISIASTTFEITGLPKLKVETAPQMMAAISEAAEGVVRRPK
jgi:small-conductance mechanosensitive channel